MSILFFLFASAIILDIKEHVERWLDRLRAPRPRRARQYKFN